MKREDCTVGASVYTDDGPLYRFNVLQEPDPLGFVKVEPAKDSWAQDSRRGEFHLDDLHFYNEEKLKKMAAEIQAKIDAAKDAFEVAFKALKEVEDFRGTDGEYISRYDLSEMDLISLKELEQTVEQGGWSSSSLWC